MAKVTIITILSVIFCCALIKEGFCQLRCYDCESSNPDKCLRPEFNHPKVTKCHSRPHNVPGENIPDFECYTIYYVPASRNRSETGMYRGCVEKRPEVNSVCTFIREHVHDGDIKTCTSCNTDKCNSEDFIV